jgi:ABC-type branched-subunit amino acid transport system substrate-binding protein
MSHAEPDQFAAQAYSGIKILAQAIEREHARDQDISIARRRAAIQKGLGKVALITPLGPFRFTREHDVDQIVWIVEANGRGAHRLVQFCDPEC